MEIEAGKIIRIINGKAIVEMETSGECQTCGAKQSCCAIGGSSKRQIEIPLVNNRDKLQEGDQIMLSYQPQARLLSAFLVFMLPIIFLIVGYFIGLNVFHTEGKAILIGLVGLLISFFVIWGLNKFVIREKNFLPQILKVQTEV